MPTLVTGSAGFIGARVAERLLEAGRRVVGVDDFSDYYLPSLKHERHARLAARFGDAFCEIEGDAAEPAIIERAFYALDVGAGADANARTTVCHLAAQAGVRHSMADPLTHVHSNVMAFTNVMETSRQVGVDRLVFASSSSVYGATPAVGQEADSDSPIKRQRVGDDVSQPLSVYAATKRADELLAHAYSVSAGLSAVGLRFFTCYGPWGRPDMAAWIFTEAMLAGRPIELYNHGQMWRDFTYVDDVVDAVLLALDADGLDYFELLNVGTGRAHSLHDLVGELEAALGVKAVAELVPRPECEIVKSCADIERTRERLGFAPKVSLREGVCAFVDWYRQHDDLTRAVAEARIATA